MSIVLKAPNERYRTEYERIFADKKQGNENKVLEDKQESKVKNGERT